jgi:hypothetical protein
MALGVKQNVTADVEKQHPKKQLKGMIVWLFMLASL